MPLFGAHMSIAGGYYKALQAATSYGMETCQLFTKNNNQWRAKPITDEEVVTFRRNVKETELKHLTAHDCYLINLASPDKELYRKSIDAFIVELQRAEMLGLSYLVAHPGAYVDSSEKAGITKIVKALDEAHKACPEFKVKVLLETTAGQGTSIGHKFEHLADIMQRVKAHQRLGICLDTCHVFAAGYALAPEKEYRATMRNFDKLIGLRNIKVFHMNDSLKPFGSRVDRHAHIGLGEMGNEPFRLLVNDRRFRTRPMIMETPKGEENGQDWDARNLRTLRKLVQSQ